MRLLVREPLSREQRIVSAFVACLGLILLILWPIGVYPTFATIVDGTGVYSMTMSPLDPAGRPLADVHLLFDPAIRRVFPRDRLPYTLMEIAVLKVDRQARLLVLWNIWQREHPEVQGIEKVAFFIAEYSVIPEDADQNPIHRQLMEVVAVPPAQP